MFPFAWIAMISYGSSLGEESLDFGAHSLLEQLKLSLQFYTHDTCISPVYHDFLVENHVHAKHKLAGTIGWVWWCGGPNGPCTQLYEGVNILFPVIAFVQQCTELVANCEVWALNNWLRCRIFYCCWAGICRVACEKLWNLVPDLSQFWREKVTGEVWNYRG